LKRCPNNIKKKRIRASIKTSSLPEMKEFWRSPVFIAAFGM
jgi:hypothetical protein